MMPDGSISSNGYGNYTEYYWYSIQGFVIPTTGYDNDFKYLGGKWFFKRITKKYIKE